VVVILQAHVPQVHHRKIAPHNAPKSAVLFAQGLTKWLVCRFCPLSLRCQLGRWASHAALLPTEAGWLAHQHLLVHPLLRLQYLLAAFSPPLNARYFEFVSITASSARRWKCSKWLATPVNLRRAILECVI
jgi:hypothetical protein